MGAIDAVSYRAKWLFWYPWELALLKHVQRHAVLIAMLNFLCVLVSIEWVHQNQRNITVKQVIQVLEKHPLKVDSGLEPLSPLFGIR